jgi:hypothetical protein
MTNYDFAYLAGLIDGEGTFDLGIHRSDVKYKDKIYPSLGCSPRLCMGLKKHLINEKIIYWVKEKFGGHVSIGRDFRWQLSGDSLRILIRELIPFLKIKGDEAKITLEALNILQKKGRGIKWNFEFAKQISDLQDEMFRIRLEDKSRRIWTGNKILQTFKEINEEKKKR